MTPATLIACLSLSAPAYLAMTQHQSSGSQAEHVAEPTNSMCPIGKEPIVPSAGTVEYKGATIGLCCPGCGKQFLAWDEARKDEFVALATAGREPGTGAREQPETDQHTAANDETQRWSALYPLATCPVSGQPLGSMGEPVVKMYGGREVRLCCGGCIDTFETDLAASWKKVHEAIVKDQLRYYPVDTCVVSGEPLYEDGEDIATNMVYGNRLVRLCCKMCERDFKADPKAFISKLDKAAADAQRKDYPLDTCIVAGGELGSMGEPTERVVAGRLMRFCCASCEPKVIATPAKYIADIDKAWQAAGKFTPEEHIDSRNYNHKHGG